VLGKRVAAVVAVTGALAFIVVAVLRVPWDPVPGGPLHPPPASSVFTAREIQRAEDYTGLQRILSWSSLAVSLALACLLGFTRVGARLVDRVRGPWWWQVVVAVVGLTLADLVVTLPLAVLLRRRVLAYGLSHQGWDGFAADLARGLAVNVVATSLALVVLVGVARRWRRAWPAVAGVLLAGLVMVGSFVYPLLVEPLFNNFRSLPDGPLRTQILALADQEHVHVDDVLVADASRRTTTLNAYVSGFGSTRRVVLYDNVVHDLPRGQILAIVAHELGHARHDDVLTGSVLAALATMLGIGLLGLVLPLVSSGTAGMRDPTSVPLVLALVAIATLLASPIDNGLSRLIETRADVASLEATRDPVSFEKMQRALDVHSLSDNGPAWSHFWFGSHPTTLEPPDGYRPDHHPASVSGGPSNT